MKKITSLVLALSMILAVGAAQAQTKTSQKKAATEVTTQKKDHAHHMVKKHHKKAKEGAKKTSKDTNAVHKSHLISKKKK